MPKGKSKSDMEQEVNSGRFPPCLCYKILYTSPEERRVSHALLKVDLLGADVCLTFSCTLREEPSKWVHIQLCCVCVCTLSTYVILYFIFVCRLYTLSLHSLTYLDHHFSNILCYHTLRQTRIISITVNSQQLRFGTTIHFEV